jgi:hypothetical protein
VDTCTGRRLTGRGAINPTTYQYDSEVETVVYPSGPCLVRPASGSEAAREFAQETQTRVDYMLTLPYTASGIQPDDRFTIDASLTDAEMVGKILLVRFTILDSYRTKLKLGCEIELGGGQQV